MSATGEDCVCCGRDTEHPDPDPWDGRLDDYCEECALARCDAFPVSCGWRERED